MQDIRFGSLVAYEASDKSKTLVLMEWCVQTEEEEGTSMPIDAGLPVTAEDALYVPSKEISWETTKKYYLLCVDEAEHLFMQNRHKLGTEVEECSEVFWIAQGLYYFREGENVTAHAVNLITGELTPGLAGNLKKYPLTSKVQHPMVKCEISLVEGLKRVQLSLSSSGQFASGAVVFTPIFTYPRHNDQGILVYDPMLGRIYQSS